MPATSQLTVDSSATYKIHVQGYLDETWSETMGSATIRAQSRPDEPPVTEVTAEFRDQSALAGALSLLFDLGLPLLSVECLGIGPTKQPCQT
jgi:hypothetical protein